jgi:hypothetical protein
MSDESAAALEIAAGDYRVTGDGSMLTAAAQDHLNASRPAGEAAAEYTAVAGAMAAGEPYDAETLGTLGTELTYARQAEAYAAGRLPGTGHSASAGIGA